MNFGNFGAIWQLFLITLGLGDFRNSLGDYFRPIYSHTDSAHFVTSHNLLFASRRTMIQVRLRFDLGSTQVRPLGRMWIRLRLTSDQFKQDVDTDFSMSFSYKFTVQI